MQSCTMEHGQMCIFALAMPATSTVKTVCSAHSLPEPGLGPIFGQSEVALSELWFPVFIEAPDLAKVELVLGGGFHFLKLHTLEEFLSKEIRKQRGFQFKFYSIFLYLIAC